jgi:hypothetical protein
VNPKVCLDEGGFMDFLEVRRQVLRRVRYAMNTLALRNEALPPEGLFDTAVTNALLAIVAHDSPGDEKKPNGQTLPATALLTLAATSPTVDDSCISAEVLREGLDLTQPARHGRADDEFAVLRADHLTALEDLDQHPALGFLSDAEGKTVDQCIWAAFLQVAEEDLPGCPKDRMMFPEPEECPECWRPTFLPSGWDAFGGTSSPGDCVACGYQRSDDAAYENAISEAIERAVSRND